MTDVLHAQAAATDEIDVTGLADRRSVCELFQATAARVPDRVALRTLGGAAELTWAEYAARVESVARGLANLGIGPGSTVAIMMGACIEFHLVDTATLHLGALPVSIYNTLPVDDIEYQLRDSGAEVVVVAPEYAAQADEARRRVGIEHLVTLGDDVADGLTLAELESSPAPGFDFAAAWRAVGPDDLATLIYTSGTTGPPKGVELSHRAILGNQQGLNLAIGLMDGGTTLSYLPMAHVAERQLSHYRPMIGGFTVTPVGDLAALPAALLEVRPDYFFSPPRLWEKFRAALISGASKDSQASAALARLVALGEAELAAGEGAPELDAAEREELAQLRAAVGMPMLEKLGLDQVKIALTGAAPVPRDLVAFWMSLGLMLIEAWGLSEAGAFGAFNRPDRFRVGTVGGSLPGVEQRLLDDGEVLLRSPWLMKGYRNSPEKTAEAIDEDGWLHTGDVGRLDGDGFLSIIDRKKEIMINAAGKNMSPANIEAKLRDADSIIAQAVVIGERRSYNVALIVLDAEALRALGAAHGLPGSSYSELIAHPATVERVQAAVDKANALMSRVEQIKKFTVLPTEWTPASDELTPTMKLRRVSVNEKYAEQIEALYA